MTLIKENITTTKYSSYNTILTHFHAAADILGISEEQQRKLVTPEKQILLLNFPVVLDNGKTRNFEGFYVIHSTLAGPARGGIVYGPDLNLHIVKAQAAAMNWKSALAGIPFGGARGGIISDPAKLSETERARLTQSYIHALNDVFTRDQRRPVQDMLHWLLDEFSILHGKSISAIVTGKHLISDKVPGRIRATGNGVSIATLLAAKKQGLSPGNTTVAIQGFGNVGLNTALSLYERNFNVLAISDINTSYYSPYGIDVRNLAAYAQQNNGSIKGYPHATPIAREDLPELDVDIFIPAAREHIITGENAGKIKARIIVEGANSPITPDADKLLHANGTLIIPDIYANAGGAIISYLEWLQNNLHEVWQVEQVQARLEEIMTRNLEDIFKYAEKHRVPLRTAAYIIALERVLDQQKIVDAWYRSAEERQEAIPFFIRETHAGGL